MNERIGIVWNPSKIDEQALREAYARAAERSGMTSVEAHWVETEVDDPGRGATEAALAAGCTVVIAAGGDGTVRAVAEQLGRSGEPAADLGIVPLGTGNLLARNLGVPLNSPAAAFERVLTRTATALDLGMVTTTDADGAEQQYGFVVMIGFGIDAQMIVETDEDLKAKAGWLAYVQSLGRATAGTEVVDFSLSLDGGEPQAERAHTLLIANCGTLQAGLTLMPDALPDDGTLDLLLLRADSAGAWLDTFRNLVWDNGLKRFAAAVTASDTEESSATSSDSIGHLRAASVRVDLPTPLDFEIDGDHVGAVASLETHILPAALRVR